MKEKEQWSRKSQQEVDSLSFRNQQLSKRVMVLQDELETLESQKKKHKVGEEGNAVKAAEGRQGVVESAGCQGDTFSQGLGVASLAVVSLAVVSVVSLGLGVVSLAVV